MLDIFSALWLILPAYFANSSATLAKGRMRIDFSRNFLDGRPIFGGGKTFEGFFLGVFAGILAGFLQSLAQNYGLGFSVSVSPMSAGIIAFGALSGDLAGSFIKRRLRLKRGTAVPLLDQLDFVAGAIFFSYFIYRIEIDTIMLIIIITPIIHLTANIIGHKLGVKKEPW